MAFQLLTWNEDRLESIATVIGPSITTAFCRSVSLPFLMKFTPVHEASTASPLDMQSDCYRQRERERTLDDKFPLTVWYIIVYDFRFECISHWVTYFRERSAKLRLRLTKECTSRQSDT